MWGVGCWGRATCSVPDIIFDTLDNGFELPSSNTWATERRVQGLDAVVYARSIVFLAPAMTVLFRRYLELSLPAYVHLHYIAESSLPPLNTPTHPTPPHLFTHPPTNPYPPIHSPTHAHPNPSTHPYPPTPPTTPPTHPLTHPPPPLIHSPIHVPPATGFYFSHRSESRRYKTGVIRPWAK